MSLFHSPVLKIIAKRIWMELRVGFIVFAGVLLFLGLAHLLSFTMVSTSVISVQSGDQMVRVAMYLGTGILALCLISMVARDGFRKVRSVRRDVREGAARGAARGTEEKRAKIRIE